MLKHGYFPISRLQRYVSLSMVKVNKPCFASTTDFDSKLKELFHNRKYGEVIQLVDERLDMCTNFNVATAINACTKLHDYKRGISIRERVSTNMLNAPNVQTSLIRFYMQHHDVESATRVFTSMTNKSNYTYTTMFKGLISNGMPEKVLDFIDEMKIRPNNFTLTLSFNACGAVRNERAMKIGRKLIEKITNDRESRDTALNAVTQMLLKFDDMESAKRYFKRMNIKNLVTYGAIIKRYIDSDMAEKALDFIEELELKPNNIICTLICSACTQLNNDRARKVGQKIVDKIRKSNEYDHVTLTAIITMLGKFGDICNAERVFKMIQDKTIVAYGAMMKAYSENGKVEEVLNLFEQMHLQPNEVILTIVFSACSVLCNDHAKIIGMKLLEEIVKGHRFDHVHVNAAINMCGKFADVENAERLFCVVQNKSVDTYCTMMKAYSDNGMGEKTLDLFEQIDLKPNDMMHTIVLNTCAQLCSDRAKAIGRKLLDEIINTNSCDNFILNTAVNMYGKLADIKKAEDVFSMIRNPNVISYAAMMKAYIENAMIERALDLFEHMTIIPDKVIYVIVFNACAELDNNRTRTIGRQLLHRMSEQYRQDSILLGAAMHMLMKHTDVNGAERIFNSIQDKTTITYGALMSGYIFNHEPEKCFQAFEEMREQNVVINNVIWYLTIEACSSLGMIRRCEYVINLIPEYIRDSVQVKTAMMNMWVKCGSIERAKQLFYSMPDRNAIAYNIMINGFGLNGMGNEAYELYSQMPSSLRNEVTYICVLNACSHSGLYDKAKIIFNEISDKTHRITAAMVDCLSRLFLFDEALDLINAYEKSNPPNFVMHMALLSGLRNNRNRILAEQIFERMKSLFPDNKEGLLSGAILVANIYSSLGEHRKAAELRSQYRRELQTSVKRGLSWTEVNGKIEKFHAHDHSHPLSSEIEAELNRMTLELKEYGHQFDSSWVTRSLQQDETMESVLCGHSEKLAIAFNFIQRPIPDFIQVTKNLRVCGDCHEFTKVIAKIRQCDIIVRDANRVHHFQKNGQCSCQDHF